ncbi:Aste57867_18592 [Aphanomyces stellatus]|uniref:Aste57867_18592 protein n=1 Tax=Aphanomyces stellatus TaxID=120398 RepID=A0A485LC02_9STRA|nr:hypothetical protein As57867_018530 [Aphanomyces stellatus]VFT95327.1 Aste57867_18592 [Aphanomyces stellatus]
MDPDDILDDMSLSSDDEMLEDMINEMKEEVKPTPTPAPRRHQRAAAAPLAVARKKAAAPPMNMPDLGQMMSQMMPMMSQMFGGGANNMQSSNNRITRAMEDVVADHVPAADVALWVETIQRDEARQQADRAANPAASNLSRAYRTKVETLPTAYLAAPTMLQELLLTAVRNARCQPSPAWEKKSLSIARDLQAQGVADIYSTELKTLLAARARRHPDYKATPARFPTITATLA